VPVLNVPAFRAGRRDTPDDGANLNRAFPGNAAGSITQRIAYFVVNSLFPQAHVVIDLHAGERSVPEELESFRRTPRQCAHSRY